MSSRTTPGTQVRRAFLPSSIQHRLPGGTKTVASKAHAAKRQPTEEQVLGHIAKTMAANAKHTHLPRLAPPTSWRKDVQEVDASYQGDTLSPVSSRALKALLYKNPPQPTQAEDDFLDELLTKLVTEKKLGARLLGPKGRASKHYWIPPVGNS